MKYEGSEIIALPTSISIEIIENRIERWLKTKTGSRYKLRKIDSEEFVLKRTWLDIWCQLCIISELIIISIDLVMLLTITSFVVFLIGVIATTYFYFIFPSRVIIHVHIQDSTVNLKLESTHKEEAEQDFDSLIDEIKSESTKPLETLH